MRLAFGLFRTGRYRLKLAGLGAALAVSLSACGFQPLHLPQTQSLNNRTTTSEMQLVYVRSSGDDRFGQLVRNSLISRLGEPARPEYQLDITSRIFQFGRGIAQDARALRFDYRAVSTVSLRTLAYSDATGRVYPPAHLFTTQLTTNAAYDETESPIAIIFAERNAEDRAAQELADLIMVRLSAFFAASESDFSGIP